MSSVLDPMYGYCDEWHLGSFWKHWTLKQFVSGTGLYALWWPKASSFFGSEYDGTSTWSAGLLFILCVSVQSGIDFVDNGSNCSPQSNSYASNKLNLTECIQWNLSNPGTCRSGSRRIKRSQSAASIMPEAEFKHTFAQADSVLPVLDLSKPDKEVCKPHLRMARYKDRARRTIHVTLRYFLIISIRADVCMLGCPAHKPIW